jgi:hypothetical protein
MPLSIENIFLKEFLLYDDSCSTGPGKTGDPQVMEQRNPDGNQVLLKGAVSAERIFRLD